VEKLRRRAVAFLRDEEFKKLELEASIKNCTVSKCIRDALLENWALKKELASSFEGLRPEAGSKEGAERVIHSLLARTEEVLARSIDRTSDEVEEVRELLGTVDKRIERLIKKLIS